MSPLAALALALSGLAFPFMALGCCARRPTPYLIAAGGSITLSLVALSLT